MKKILPVLIIAVMAMILVSCSEDDNVINELQDLKLAATFTNTPHTVEFYTPTGKFQTGYNAIYFQIKDAQGNRIQKATAVWQPMMNMMDMSHSCPASLNG